MGKAPPLQAQFSIQLLPAEQPTRAIIANSTLYRNPASLTRYSGARQRNLGAGGSRSLSDPSPARCRTPLPFVVGRVSCSLWGASPDRPSLWGASPDRPTRFSRQPEPRDTGIWRPSVNRVGGSETPPTTPIDAAQKPSRFFPKTTQIIPINPFFNWTFGYNPSSVTRAAVLQVNNARDATGQLAWLTFFVSSVSRRT